MGLQVVNQDTVLDRALELARGAKRRIWVTSPWITSRAVNLLLQDALPRVRADELEVRIVYLRGEAGSGFDDPAQAQKVATRLYRNGADVIFHAAGSSGLGLFQAAYQVSGEVGEHLWAIGVDADQYREIRYAVGEDLAAAWRDHILTSMLKRFDTAVYTIMAEHARGDWMGGGRWFGLAEEGVGLAASGGFIDDIRPELDRLSSRIISGEIEVPTIPARMRGTDEPRSPER